MLPEAAHSMNGGGSLAHRAWDEAARAHERINGQERLYQERHDALLREVGLMRDSIGDMNKAIEAQGSLARNAIEAVKQDISAKVSGLYGRIWWIVGGVIGSMGMAIVWLANKAFA